MPLPSVRATRIHPAALVLIFSAWMPQPAMAQQVTSPISGTLPVSAPIQVEWTPTSYWPPAGVQISINRVVANGWFPVAPATTVPNTGQAYVQAPANLACDPAHTYMISVEGKISGNVTVHRQSAKFRFSCRRGALTVFKTVINASPTLPPPSGTFQATVSCPGYGPPTTVTLTPANGYTQSVPTLPANGHCTVVEAPPSVPDDLARQGCRWDTTYRVSDGDAVVDSAGGDRRRARAVDRPSLPRHEIVNRWSCPGPGSGGDTIVVSKEIVNPTEVPIGDGGFEVRVDCKPAGPSEVVVLVPPDRLRQEIRVPRGSHCVVSEVEPVAPKPCRWVVTYPRGSETKPGGAVVIRNTLVCPPVRTATLTVTKKVVDLRADEPMSGPAGGFPVSVTCTDGTSQAFQLPRGGSHVLSGLPVGTTCTVTEVLAQALLSSPESCASVNADPTGTYSDGGLSHFRGPAIWSPPAYAPGAVTTLVPGPNTVTITNSFQCVLGRRTHATEGRG